MRARSSLWYAFSRWRWQQYERSLSMKTAPTMGCAQSQHMVMCEAGRGLENPDAAFSPSSLTQMGASASEAKTLGGAVCSVASRGDRPAPGWSVTSVDAVEDASDLLRASVEAVASVCAEGSTAVEVAPLREASRASERRAVFCSPSKAHGARAGDGRARCCAVPDDLPDDVPPPLSPSESTPLTEPGRVDATGAAELYRPMVFVGFGRQIEPAGQYTAQPRLGRSPAEHDAMEHILPEAAAVGSDRVLVDIVQRSS
eukprot:scaffold19457_cov140-Isochrysis_galbana.AAC.1